MAIIINPAFKQVEDASEREHLVTSMMMRGNVLHYFSIVEKLMDDIIRRTMFDSVDAYYEYMGLFRRGELPMPAKKILLRFCIDKVNRERNINILGFEHLEDIVTRRNALTHYPLDTTDEGLPRFVKEGVFKFIGINKDGKEDQVNFTKDSCSKFIQRIIAMAGALSAMQNILDGREIEDNET